MSIRFYSSADSTEPLFEFTLQTLNNLANEKGLRRSESPSNITFEITWGELKEAIYEYMMTSGMTQQPNQTIRYIQIFNSVLFSVTMYVLLGGKQTAYDAYSMRVQISPNVNQLPDSTVITISYDRNPLPPSVLANIQAQAQSIAASGGLQLSNINPSAQTVPSYAGVTVSDPYGTGYVDISGTPSTSYDISGSTIYEPSSSASYDISGSTIYEPSSSGSYDISGSNISEPVPVNVTYSAPPASYDPYTSANYGQQPTYAQPTYAQPTTTTTVEGFSPKARCNISNVSYYLLVFLVVLLILIVLFYAGCWLVGKFD